MASILHADEVEPQEAVRTMRVRAVACGAVLMIAAAAVALSIMVVPAAAVTPGPPGTSQVPQGEPRYTVEVKSFKALDEWGWDFDSDEVFGVFDSTRGYPTATSVYGQVDSGDRINLPRLEQCLAPQRVLSGSVSDGLWARDDMWECDPGGVPAPIGLDLELWEDEGCNAFFPTSCFDGYNGGPVDSADGLIGRAAATYTAAELASRLRTVGSTLLQAFTLGGPCGYQAPDHVCGEGLATGPEYQVLVSIHRVSDAPLRSTQ